MLVMLAATVSIFSTPEFWVAVAFFGFVGLLIYYGVPGLVAKTLDDRADAIRKELDEARRLREEAQALLADYQKRTREAEAEAKAIVDQARKDAEAMAAETRTSLKESLERRTKLAEDKIARAETQALSEVRSAAVDAAVTAAERILRTKVTTEVDASLVDQGIRDLRGKLN
jgi:F-type H+-transporting ATPase subunit b